MPKSKTRKKSTKGKTKSIDWGVPATKGSGRINLVLGAVALAALVAGGVYFWQLQQTGSAFDVLIAEGQPALARVETTPDRGGGHLEPGQGHSYGIAFPTSGIHDRVPIGPGFYTEPQRATQLVHSVEHGHIVIYYEDPGAEARDTIEAWTTLFGGNWDGVVAVPSSGLGKAVVLTAWRKMLKLDTFEPASAAAFVDAYRGRGPENKVR
jgi:hypothetical protein